jgi:cytochrome c oxidase subunit 2
VRETPGRPRAFALLALGAVVVLAAGCGSSSNTLQPHSHPAHEIANLWWVMFAVACGGFVLVVVLLFLGWVRRNRASLPFGGGDRAGTIFVVGLGVLMPMVLLTALFVWSDVFVIRSTASPLPGTSPVRVTVTGRQWFWDIQYPNGAIAADELHIPVRTRVDVTALTGDVIHSLWIPELNRKMDMIPGKRNHLLLVANQPGTYVGRCAEYCGLQHAHMEIYAIAQPAAQYRAWVRHEAQPAPTPGGGAAARGLHVFLTAGCAACHQIRGTAAHARVGPDLTHFGSHREIAAGTLPNTRAQLADWIRNPQHAKPGARMPALHLTNADVNALVAYLEGLK